MESVTSFKGLPVVSGPSWPGIRYFTTTRLGGVSKSFWESFNLGLHTTDCEANVMANRQRLVSALPGQPVWLNQQHGTNVHIADSAQENTTALGSDPVADAAVTIVPGQVVAVLTADCLPIVISSTDALAVGVAHAGWRGLASGVIENTVRALKRLHPHPNASWQAWIGPCIHQGSFQVGEEVRAAFLQQHQANDAYFQPDQNGKYMANLVGLARSRLKSAGVGIVHASSKCTYENPDLFYSYRRNNVTGRQATLVWISLSELLG